jgi:galactonate dehydratase
MEIADVRLVSLTDGLWKPWTHVLVETRDGLVGVGQASADLDYRAKETHLEVVEDRFAGADPTDLGALHDRAERVPGSLLGLFPGIELACWDLAGKHYGAPVHALLGGTHRDELRAYANRWYGGCETPGEWADAAEEVVDAGYGGMKLNPFEDEFTTISNPGLGMVADRFAAIRDRIGPDPELFVEMHSRFTTAEAIRIGERLEAFDPGWFEAPVRSSNPADYREVREALSTPVASDGAGAHGPEEAFEFLSSRALDIVQPDPVVSGLWTSLQTAIVADAAGALVGPHAAAGPVSLAADVHLGAAIPNFLIQETDEFTHPDWVDDVVSAPVAVEDGAIPVPDDPGLGIEFDEAAARERAGTLERMHDIGSGDFKQSFE